MFYAGELEWHGQGKSKGIYIELPGLLIQCSVLCDVLSCCHPLQLKLEIRLYMFHLIESVLFAFVILSVI